MPLGTYYNTNIFSWAFGPFGTTPSGHFVSGIQKLARRAISMIAAQETQAGGDKMRQRQRTGRTRGRRAGDGGSEGGSSARLAGEKMISSILRANPLVGPGISGLSMLCYLWSAEQRSGRSSETLIPVSGGDLGLLACPGIMPLTPNKYLACKIESRALSMFDRYRLTIYAAARLSARIVRKRFWCGMEFRCIGSPTPRKAC